MPGADLHGPVEAIQSHFDLALMEVDLAKSMEGIDIKAIDFHRPFKAKLGFFQVALFP